ncbi:MAG: DUF551 domain-containing protein [Bacteroidales bacterium]|nr:DUF551 domain-containing protein [Bacteroidales bacterium]
MEWISTKIKEKLPADFQDVLLYQENNGVFIGWLDNGKWIVDNTFVEAENLKTEIRGNIRQEEITFWRPLPPNPLWDFFDTEYKTCEEWYQTCHKTIKIRNFNRDTQSREFNDYWYQEKVSRDEFIKRLMNMEIERL